MTSRLTDLLDRAVPDPPPLAGLAARAEADARRARARARRRTTVVAAALVLVAVATSVTVGSRTTPPTASDEVVPDPATAEPCRPGTPEAAKDAVRDEETDAAPASVRFCAVDPDQPRGGRPPALVPEVALTTRVATTVEALEDAVMTAARAFCVTERNPYRIQIAYEDGSVRNLPSEDCARGYPILLEAIGRQQAAPVADLDGPALSCPPRPAARLLSAVSDDEPGDVRSLLASSALRCDFEAGRLIDSELLSGADAEALRATLLSSYSSAMVDCGAGPDAPVHTWVLRLADASVHTATVDGTRCGALRIDGRYLGLTGRALRDLIDG